MDCAHYECHTRLIRNGTGLNIPLVPILVYITFTFNPDNNDGHHYIVRTPLPWVIRV